ncbi:HlyD family secretion protein [Fundidesulfovibrio putealis]|uniref:HlyD family secretion protein n=1 Tax=Fundidesulfovibrio putealis TaxID=270496 RepID=UPI00040B73A1|nr:efflux RND transporter periplasmic adaptor subunit [Fundidesulfovibrio putealis]
MTRLLAILACVAGTLIGPVAAWNGESIISRIPQEGSWVAAAGRVEPVSEEMRLGFDIPGKILEVYVEEGDLVKKGQPMARLVDDDIKARLAQAKANEAAFKATLDKVLAGARPMERTEAAAALREAESVLSNARRENERRVKLVASGVISREEADRAEREYLVALQRTNQLRERFHLVDDPAREEDIRNAQAQYAQAQAQVAEAQAYADKALVRSPIDGVLLRKHRRAGEMVSTNFDTPVVTVGDVSTLRVRADVDEKDVARIEVGQRAYAMADAYGDKRFNGKVIRIARMLGRKNIRTDDPAERLDTKVLETLIEFEPGTSIPVGMRMDVFILLDGAGK